MSDSLIKPPEIQAHFSKVGLRDDDPDPENIWADDCCEREETAKRLASFIKVQTESLTIALDGSWGSGKTFFLRRFVEYVKHQGDDGKRPVAIYLNAWECDYLRDPLFYVFKGISDCLADLGMMDKEHVKTLLNNVGHVIFGITDAATLGTLGKIRDSVEKEIAANPVAVFESQTELTKSLKTELARAAQVAREKTEWPLVVCIDELDRCRPTYSIEMLERVKHCFSVPNVVFVFGTDKKQLSACIESVYGKIETENYLRKFFQFTLPLPPASPSQYVGVLWKEIGIHNIVNALANQMGVSLLDTFYNRFSIVILQTSSWLIGSTRNVTLREVEEIVCRNFRIGISSVLPHLSDYILLSVLSILKTKDPYLLKGYIARIRTPKDVFAFFFGNRNPEETGRSDMISPEQVLLKVLEAGVVTEKDSLASFYETVHRWPSVRANEANPDFGNSLATCLKMDITNAINGTAHHRFRQSRAKALLDRMELRFNPDKGWYAN